MKKLILNELTRCQPASLRKKTYSHILFHVFCPHFLRMHHDYFFWRGFEKVEHNFFQWKVVLLLIYCSITIYLSQLSPCWVWHLTFFWEQFLSNKLESFVSCNIKHFALCFDMYFFYKNLIILHHRDNNFLFWHLWSNSHFQQ